MIQETFPMIVGEEEVLNERELLVRVESGLMMDSTDSVCYIILHCSATRCNSDYTVEQLLRDHRARGFRTIGYHFYVRRDGTVSQHRRLLEVGAHCRPFNRCSIGVCYEGGLDSEGHPADTLTPEQFENLEQLLTKLLKLFPKAQLKKMDEMGAIVMLHIPKAQLRGHRDMPGSVPKACPCLDCQSVFRAIL